jgi:hypothetical protein
MDLAYLVQLGYMDSTGGYSGPSLENLVSHVYTTDTS